MTGEQLLHGLWAILPEIILLLLGIVVITIDLIKLGQTSGRTFGYSLQSKLQSEPDFAVSRLICPRHLSPNTFYTAFVIPAFEAGRLAGLGLDAATIEGVRSAETFMGYN